MTILAERLQFNLVPRDWPLDPLLLVPAAMLLGLSLIMVASASSEVSARNYGDPFAMFLRHGLYVVIALAGAMVALSVPIAFWQRIDWLLLLVGVGLLVAVLIPGVGREANGSTRWIGVGGFSLQGSEFLKFFIIVYLSGYLVRHGDEVREEFVGFAKPLLVLSVIAALLVMQPDFGTFVVIAATVMTLLFVGGVPMRFYLPVVALGGAAVVALAMLKPYRVERLTVFADPWAHQFEGAYQLTQALIAYGRAELMGLGLGNSIQKLFFLPEAHTDFVYSIIAEELGLIGALAVVCLFAILVFRGVAIGRLTETQGRHFHAYMAYGLAFVLGFQALVNIGVNIGVLPTKGLTLPLVSYGGNSLIVSCAMVAVLLRIEYEARQPVPRARRKGRAT